MDKVSGFLEILPKGFGFLRDIKSNFKASNTDVFVSPPVIRSSNLREGMFIEGETKKQENGKKQLTKIIQINGRSPAESANAPDWKEQTSINPDRRLNLCAGKNDFMGKVLNFVTPTGFGQRGMIISPPKTGKTTLLKQYAHAIERNHPDVKIFILLVDERPEEVTDFRRSLKKSYVLSSSADESSANHLRQVRLTMNSAIREAESGKDVLVIIDSLTRMARAFNRETDSRSKTLSGGIGANALELPRRFFGAARNIEDGGSLTVIASILVGTGSRMDDVIYQEFKGTGNLDMVLSDKCAEQRLYPAININASGTRKEELLFNDSQYMQALKLRRLFSSMSETEAMQFLKSKPESLDEFKC